MIDVRLLQYFVVVGEELHLGRASERLRISKPTLSQQLKVLERRLGVILLERGHRLGLTEPGKVLLREARQLLTQYEHMLNAVASASQHPAELDVRVTNGLDVVMRSRLSALSREDAPPTNLVITNGLDAEYAVATGRADAAIVWLPNDDADGMKAGQIGQAEVCLLMPDGHELTSRESVPVSMVQNERVVLFPRQTGPRVYDVFVGHLFPQGVPEEQVVTPSMPIVRLEDILTQVVESNAVAPFVHEVAEALDAPGVVLRALDPPLHLPIHLIWKDSRGPRVEALLRFLRTGRDEIVGRPTLT